MGLLDNMKSKLGPAKEKVSGLAHEHGGKIQHGIDRAARIADEKTKGKYTAKIEKGTGKAKQAMERLSQHGEHEGHHRKHVRHHRHGEGPTPPPPPPSQ